jgi:hypothetical protein
VAHRGEQGELVVVTGSDSSEDLAVDGDAEYSVLVVVAVVAQPSADGLVQVIGIDPGEQVAYGFFAGNPVAPAEMAPPSAQLF